MVEVTNKPDIEINDYDINWDDWNGRLRSIVELLAGLIPEVGQLIDVILIIFWPDVTKKKPDIWSQIASQIGRLIDSKILAAELAQRKEELDGLRDTMRQYYNAKIHEKGSLMSAMIAQCNTIYEELTETPNYLHTGPLAAAHSHLHLGVLRERLEHGKKMYEEDNTKIWRQELHEAHDKYQKWFDKFVADWKTWRFGKITARWWRKWNFTLLPPFYYWVAYGEAQDPMVSGEKISYTESNNNPSADHFKSVMQSAQTRMQNQQLGGMASSMVASYFIGNYLQGHEKDAPVVNPLLAQFEMGPYCPANLGLSRSDWAETNVTDKAGKIKQILIREWNSIDGIQFFYTDHNGHFMGNPKGGQAHNIKVDLTKAHFTGMWMQFANGLLIAVDIHKSDKSHTGKLGNRGGWGGPARSAIVDPFYEMAGAKYAKGYGPSSTIGTSVITLYFKATSLM
jgi:hypothetical protein